MARTSQAVFWYDIDCRIILCCLHALYPIVYFYTLYSTVPKPSLLWYNNNDNLKTCFSVTHLRCNFPADVFSTSHIPGHVASLKTLLDRGQINLNNTGHGQTYKIASQPSGIVVFRYNIISFYHVSVMLMLAQSNFLEQLLPPIVRKV